jgi:fructosamine-3-kinase
MLHHEKIETIVGLDFDTLIGSIHQPNPQMDSWIDFYREHRSSIWLTSQQNRGNNTTRHPLIHEFF